ncbi:MAG: hypothetical protein PVI91_16230, partial [Gammaproteobacteria bacterium]
FADSDGEVHASPFRPTHGDLRAPEETQTDRYMFVVANESALGRGGKQWHGVKSAAQGLLRRRRASFRGITLFAKTSY